MAFLQNAGRALGAVGLSDSKLGRGLVGLQNEQSKAASNGAVFFALFLALAFGITAIIFLATGVADLPTFADYFKTTRHQIGFGFAGATLLTLLVTSFLLSAATECEQKAESQRPTAFVQPAQTTFAQFQQPVAQMPPQAQFAAAPFAPSLSSV